MDRSRRPRLGFIGTGVVAESLARALSSAGYSVVAVHGRDPRKAAQLAAALPGARAAASRQVVADQADLVVLAVPDDAIVTVAAGVAWTAGRAVVHCNGAASADLLHSARQSGADVGVFHPLQSFASVDQALRLIPGSTFRLEASSARLRDDLERMALALGGRPLSIEGDPTLYHLSAVLASNYLVALLDLASEMWTDLGLRREDGLRALLPLVRGTVENVERLGTPAALTGPIARGDVGTVAHHVETLQRVAPHIVPVYKELARRAVEMSLAKGTIDSSRARQLEAALRDEGAAPRPEREGDAGCA